MESQISEKKVFIAMSGGVDSSVAAALLKKRGFEVRGVHMKMWSDPSLPCTAREDRLDAMRVAARLGIPFETWDFTEEYRKAVVEYMVREYAAGQTPNPDVMCNREIKFGIFLKEALRRGADFVATGHYIRAVPSPRLLPLTNGTSPSVRGQKGGARPREFSPLQEFKLLKGVDGEKDQSYFLWTLTQKQLRHCLFPIGDYKKIEVREMARKLGLPTAEKPDSQGVCFIGEFNMREFLQRYIPMRPGLIVVSAGGRKIGTHDGLSFYTIGQRQGIGIGGGIPYYVAEKDFKTNTLVVAEGPYDEKLFRSELIAEDVNWISGKAPRLPLRCEARIRYRQPLQPCRIEENLELRTQNSAGNNLSSKFLSLNSCRIKVCFDAAQRAVTPGQSIVFYRGDEMLGGGVIC